MLTKDGNTNIINRQAFRRKDSTTAKPVKGHVNNHRGMYMDNIKTAEWLEERNIILEKGFVEELQDLMIAYKKRTGCVH